jgi:hypothetical protein
MDILADPEFVVWSHQILRSHFQTLAGRLQTDTILTRGEQDEIIISLKVVTKHVSTTSCTTCKTMGHQKTSCWYNGQARDCARGLPNATQVMATLDFVKNQAAEHANQSRMMASSSFKLNRLHNARSISLAN